MPNNQDMGVIGDGRSFIDAAVHFQQLMMLYECAAKMIVTRVDILRKEFRVKGIHCPIEVVKSRVKKPESIVRKLLKAGEDVTFENIEAHLNDVAGVRVVCPYISDIYTVRNIICAQKDITLIKEKDYVQNPKKSGYRSLHLIVEVPVQLSKGERPVRVEIQLRTISMDSWATVEHNLRYKADSENVTEEAITQLKECAERLSEIDKMLEQVARQIQPDEYSYDWTEFAEG